MEEREAGRLEIYSVKRNVLNMFSIVIVSATYSISLDSTVLYPAVYHAIVNQPMLGARIHNCHSKIPIVKKLKTIDLDKVVKYADDQKVDSFCNNALQNFKLCYDDETLPLWMVYVLNDKSELVFIYDHSLFDGGSGPLFHKYVLEGLQMSKTNFSSSTVPVSELPLPKNLEKLIDVHPSWFCLMKALWTNSGLPFSKGFRSPSYKGHAPVRPFSSHTIFFSISNTVVKNIKQLSKSIDASFTSIFYSVFMLSIYNAIAENGKVNLDMLIDVNARRFLPVAKQTMGNYVFSYVHHLNGFQPSQRQEDYKHTMVDLATEFSHRLKAALSNPREMSQQIGLLSYIDIEDYLLKSCEKTRGNTAEISNLGYFSFPADSSVKIKSMTFAQPCSSLSAPFVLNVITVADGPCSFSLSIFDDGNTEQTHELAIKIRDKFLSILEKVSMNS